MVALKRAVGVSRGQFLHIARVLRMKASSNLRFEMTNHVITRRLRRFDGLIASWLLRDSDEKSMRNLREEILNSASISDMGNHLGTCHDEGDNQRSQPDADGRNVSGR